MIPVVINAQSRSGKASTYADTLRRLAAQKGYSLSIHVASPKTLSGVIAELAAQKHPHVIIGGGDGTLRSAAQAFAGTSTAVGILPVGTRNHLARDLNLPLRLEHALDVAVNGGTRQIDVGRLEGQVFLNTSAIGLHPQMVRLRQALPGRFRFISTIKASFLAFWYFKDLRANLTTPTDRRRLITPFIFIGNNHYQISKLRLRRRPRLDGGELCVFTIRQSSRIGLLKIAVFVLLGRARSAAAFEEQRTSECTINLSPPRVLVSLDGEIVRMRSPLRYDVWPGALTVKVRS